MAETPVGTLVAILQEVWNSTATSAIKVVNLLGKFAGQIDLGVQLGYGGALAAIVIILIVVLLVGKFIIGSIKTLVLLFVVLLLFFFVFGAFL